MIGEVIDHYRVLELVGSGGMGSVYKAVDIHLDRIVALKVLNAALQNDPEFVERFHHEARIQAKLIHSNIATLFGFFIHKGSPVAVMEFIDGDTLQARIRDIGPIPAHISLPLFKQALQGVAAGHRRGIIHRDLKPANLMVDSEGTVKVTDFGIAKLQNSTGRTMMSTRIGTSFYMAPEQIVGQKVDQRTDIYAMGITLYELLSGQTPFSAPSQYQIEHAHVNTTPPAPTIHYPHIPQAAVDAVMRALEKDPARRFETAEAFMQALPDLQGKLYSSSSKDVALPRMTKDSGPGDTIDLAAKQLKPDGVQPRVVPPPPPAIARPDEGRAGKHAVWIGGGVVAVLIGAGVIAALVGEQNAPPVHYSASIPAGSNIIDVISGPRKPPPTPPTDNKDSSVDPPVQAPSVMPEPTKPKITALRHQDLPGIWTATYADASGQTKLTARIDLTTDLTGDLTYESGTCDGKRKEKCCDVTLRWQDAKRLQMSTACHDDTRTDEATYLNAPVNFDHLQSDHLQGMDYKQRFTVSMTKVSNNVR